MHPAVIGKRLIGAVRYSRVMMRAFLEGGFMAKAKLRRKVVPWSKDDVKNLRAFAKSRLSGTQAAKKLKRTPGAVAQKAMKLKVSFRSVRKKAG
jgi:hypothetical protein